MLHRLKLSFRGGLLVMLVGALFLAACSSDDDADDPGSSTAAPTDVSSTDQTDPDESETTESSSAAAEGDDTEGDDTEGDGTEGDGTDGDGTDQRDEVLVAVEVALNEGHLAFLGVVSEPVGTDLDEIGRWFDVDRSGVIGEFVGSIQEAGLAVRRGELELEQIVVESIELVSPELAEVVYCLSTDSVIYDVTDQSVVDDSVGAFRYSTSVSFEGGRWKDGVQVLVEFFVGPDCLTSP